jgi:phosphate transport system permease protein
MTIPDHFSPHLDPDLNLSIPLAPERQIFSSSMTGLAFFLSGIALLPLGSILWEIVWRGASQLRWNTLFTLPIGNALLGTFLIVGGATLWSVPLGVITAIFLTELSRRNSKTANSVRFIVTVMSGVPSIVVGIFAWIIIVFTTKQFSALAGSVALGIIMLPIIVLSTEEALKLVPNHQRLASSALGADTLQTTFRVVVMSALPGITTGILLAIARAAGEAAPLIMTTLFSQNWPDVALNAILNPMASMSVLIYNFGAVSPYPEENNFAWTTSLVLLGIILLINLTARLVTHRRLTSR